jgi:hypothetical protein
LKAKLWLFFAFVLFSLSFAALVSAQSGQVYFKEDFNYANLDQMQAAGWTFTRPAGISVGSGAVVLNGVAGDCTINYNNHFQTGIFNWKVESKSMWLGKGHTTNGVYVSTQKHSYSFSADGYYDEFAFYRDNVKILRFGSYQETANQYFFMTMVRQANTFSLYFNGELKNTYIEEDTQQSAATGIALCSPWRGDAKYDYYQLGEPTAVFTSSNPTVSTDSFPMIPALVGGGIAAVVVGGIVVYYFFIAGGSSASAGASAGSTGSGGGGPIIQEHPISPLSGEAPPSLSPQALADIALHYPPEAYPSGEQPISLLSGPSGVNSGGQAGQTNPTDLEGNGEAGVPGASNSDLEISPLEPEQKPSLWETIVEMWHSVWGGGGD